MSHPVWGAWIEKYNSLISWLKWSSHPVWGAWIEIRLTGAGGGQGRRRTPCGVRGLKSEWIINQRANYDVAPRVGCVD